MDAKHINLMTCSSQNPDLHPNDNAWAVLKKLHARPTSLTNTTELFNVLQSECVSIPDEYFKKLVCLMPNRVSTL